MCRPMSLNENVQVIFIGKTKKPPPTWQTSRSSHLYATNGNNTKHRPVNRCCTTFVTRTKKYSTTAAKKIQLYSILCNTVPRYNHISLQIGDLQHTSPCKAHQNPHIHTKPTSGALSLLTITQKWHGHYMVIIVRRSIQPVTTSLLSVGEDKRDLLHKGPQPGTETITSTQLDHRLHCLTHKTVQLSHNHTSTCVHNSNQKWSKVIVQYKDSNLCIMSVRWLCREQEWIWHTYSCSSNIFTNYPMS